MPEIPSVAAICVYPSLVGDGARSARGHGVKAASVATGFPAGQASLEAKLRDTEDAVAAGADEIDMVISREAFLAGDDTRVQQEIVAVKEALRRRPPQGDPRDRRARLLRPRPPRLDARDGGGRGLHQDLDGQVLGGRDARRRAW